MLLLAACALAQGQPAIDCPDGARPEGATPPAGYELKCVLPDGTAHGPWLTWYQNGQLMSRKTMEQGVEHGLQRSWWPNGQLMMEGTSVHGHRYQGFKYWNMAGEQVQLDIEREATPTLPTPPQGD